MRTYSPSSVDLGTRCERAWWYRYHMKLKEKEIPWAEIEAAGKAWEKFFTWRQRSKALGTAIHSVLETWYLGDTPNWTTLPGQIALDGARHLPHPTLCERIQVEYSIGRAPGDDFSPTYYDTGSVKMMGFVDLRAKVFPAELARLGIDASRTDGWVQFDYKSTRDPKWIKTVPELLADGQASLYAVDFHDQLTDQGTLDIYTELFPASQTPLPHRWVYFRTQGKREAKPIDFFPTYKDAIGRVHLMTEQAEALEALESFEACLPNTAACDEYGGCMYHKDRGGPCDAQRRLGSAIQARVRKKQGDNHMGQFGAKFRAMQGGEAPAPAPAAAPQAPPAPASQAAPPPAPAVARGPRVPRAPRAAAPAPVAQPLAPASVSDGNGRVVFKLSVETEDLSELQGILGILSDANGG